MAHPFPKEMLEASVIEMRDYCDRPEPPPRGEPPSNDKPSSPDFPVDEIEAQRFASAVMHLAAVKTRNGSWSLQVHKSKKGNTVKNSFMVACGIRSMLGPDGLALFIRFLQHAASPQGAALAEAEARTVWGGVAPQANDDDAGPGSIYEAAFAFGWLVPDELWGDVTPLYNTAAAPPFDTSALAPIISEPVQALAYNLQVSEEVALSSLLAAISLIAQGHINVQRYSTDIRIVFIPASLSILVIAESGERKSEAFREVMKGIELVIAVERGTYETEKAKYEIAKRLYERDVNALTKANRNNPPAPAPAGSPGPPPASLAQQIFNLHKPVAPRTPYRLPSEPTTEALLQRYQNERALSLGLFNPDAGAFLGGFSMGKDKLLHTAAVLSHMWDGFPVDMARVGNDGSKGSLYDRRLATLLMVQPGVAKGTLENEVLKAQGLFSRFLIGRAASLAGTRHRRTDAAHLSRIAANSGVLANLTLTIERLAKLPLPTKPGLDELSLRMLPLSQSAFDMLDKFHTKLEDLRRDKNSLAESEFTNKAVEQACRIAGCVQYFMDPASPEVSDLAAHTAIQIVNLYLNQGPAIRGEAKVSQWHETAMTLYRWLRRRGKKTTTIRDILRADIPGGAANADRVERLLETLAKHNYVVKGGKHVRSDVWQVRLDLPPE